MSLVEQHSSLVLSTEMETDKIHTLIVEDNLDHLELIKNVLGKTKFDYVIDQATTGKEAVEKIKNKKYNLAIIDVGLPDMTGFTVVREAKLADLGLVTIMISTSSSSIDIHHAYQLSVVAYIVKPSRYVSLIPFFDGLSDVMTNESYRRPNDE